MKYVFPVCLKSNQSRKIVVTTSGAHKLLGVPPFLLPCFDEKKKKKKKKKKRAKAASNGSTSDQGRLKT